MCTWYLRILGIITNGRAVRRTKPRHAVQELRFTNVILARDGDNDDQLSTTSPHTTGSPGALAHLERLTLLINADRYSVVKMDNLQQLGMLAPQTGRLAALKLHGLGVLARSRTAELAATLRLLPNLRDLEVCTLPEKTSAG